MRLRSAGWAVGGGLVWMLSGCGHYAHYRDQPLTVDATEAAFESRTLTDPGLRRFLAAHSRAPEPWPPGRWDFETLCWVAFYFNPDLAVTREQWRVAVAGIGVAQARPNPTISFVPGYNTNPSPGLSPWLPMVGFDIPVTTAGKRRHLVDESRAAAESARQAVFAAAWQLRGDLRHALIDWAADRRRLAQSRQTEATQRDVLELLKQRHAAGAIDAQEVATAQISLVRTQAALADTERAVPVGLALVARILGLPAAALDHAKLEAPAPALPASAVLMGARRRALLGRPDILAALARYQAAQAALALEVARQYPDLHLGPAYQYNQGLNTWTLNLTLELPILQHNEGAVVQAAAGRREAAAEFVALQAKVIAEIDSAAAEAAAARKQADRLTQLSAQLGQQERRVLERVDEGQADKFEAAASRLETMAGAATLIEAQTQAAQAVGRLEDALEVPLPTVAFPLEVTPLSP